jgi:hypothetical protein
MYQLAAKWPAEQWWMEEMMEQQERMWLSNDKE